MGVEMELIERRAYKQGKILETKVLARGWCFESKLVDERTKGDDNADVLKRRPYLP